MIPHIVAKKAIGGIYNKTPREGEENTNTPSVYHQRVCRVDSTLANKRTYSNTHKKTEFRVLYLIHCSYTFSISAKGEINKYHLTSPRSYLNTHK